MTFNSYNTFDDFGLTIFFRREELNYSIEEIATIVGVSARTVYYWESNQKKPNKRHFMKITEILKLNKEALNAWGLLFFDFGSNSSNIQYFKIIEP